MESADLMLDGNAIGGLLGEVFVEEMTVAQSTCAACGAVREVGALHVYVHAPGTVVRCPGCEAVLVRVAHGEGRIWLDLRGVSCLELRVPRLDESRPFATRQTSASVSPRSQDPRLQVVPGSGRGAPRAGRRRGRRPERLGQVEHRRRDRLGGREPEPERASRREARGRPLRRLEGSARGRLVRGRAPLRQRGRRRAAGRGRALRSSAARIAAATASTSSTGRASAEPTSSSCWPTSASRASGTRSSARAGWRRSSSRSRRSGGRWSRRPPASASSSAAATGPS